MLCRVKCVSVVATANSQPPSYTRALLLDSQNKQSLNTWLALTSRLFQTNATAACEHVTLLRAASGLRAEFTVKQKQLTVEL